MTLNPKAAFDDLSANEWNELLRLAQPLFARATGNDSNAVTTLRSHPQLTLTPDINSVYTFTAWMRVTMPAAQDLKLQWVVPSGAAGWWTVKNVPLSGTTPYMNTLDWTGGASSAILEGSGSDVAVECFGVLRLGPTPGAFTMQYAPNTAGTVTVVTDSMIELRKR